MEQINLHTLQGTNPRDSDFYDDIAVFQNSDYLWEDFLYANLTRLNNYIILSSISFKRYANT